MKERNQLSNYLHTARPSSCGQVEGSVFFFVQHFKAAGWRSWASSRTIWIPRGQVERSVQIAIQWRSKVRIVDDIYADAEWYPSIRGFFFIIAAKWDGFNCFVSSAFALIAAGSAMNRGVWMSSNVLLGTETAMVKRRTFPPIMMSRKTFPPMMMKRRKWSQPPWL